MSVTTFGKCNPPRTLLFCDVINTTRQLHIMCKATEKANVIETFAGWKGSRTFGAPIIVRLNFAMKC